MLGVGCVFLLVDGVTGILLATELARPGVGFLSTSRYDEVLVDHSTAAVALSLWPLAIGLALTRIRPGLWARPIVAAGAVCLLGGGALTFAATDDVQTV